MLLAMLLLLGVHGADTMLGWAEDVWARLQTMPAWIYFLSMAVICIFPVPISPFYLAAGPLYGISTSLLWISIAVALNQLAAYALTAGVLRPVIAHQLERLGYSIPAVRDPRDQWLFTFLLRAVPGVPYSLQNLTLGLAGIERHRYLAVSWPVQMLWAVAWLVAGESAFEGHYGMLITAVAVLIAIALVGRWIGARAKRAHADLIMTNEVSASEKSR